MAYFVLYLTYISDFGELLAAMHYRGEGCDENENTARYLLKIAKEAEDAQQHTKT